MNITFSRLVYMVSIALCSQISFSQVGIGTTNPQQKLHVAGAASTIRIDAFNTINSPTKNNGIDLSPLAVNGNGDLVLGGTTFLSQIEVDEDNTVFINPAVYVRTTDGSLASVTLDTRSITLTQETLVEVNYNISCAIDDGATATPASNGPITDTLNRVYGGVVFINGSLEGANANNFSNGEVTPPWWSGGTTTYKTGYFTLTGSVYSVLPAGTHTITMAGYVSGVESDWGFSGAVGASFGNGYSRLIVIKHN